MMDKFGLPLELPLLMLLCICMVSLLIQLYYILVVHGKLAFHKTKSAEDTEDTALVPLSVIICTRNQENLLRENLEKILTQDYPEFEVIVVNDRSDDDTKWYLKELNERFQHLKIVEIAEHVLSRSGKKFGVAIGIKAAKYDHLIFTDADCTPNSDKWLYYFGRSFNEQHEILLGYAPLQRKKGLMNTLIRFEHFIRSINYLAFALNKKAYMGLGQNMAYAKELFFKGKGFASHIHVKAGYDELFVNQHANRYNTQIVIHKDAHVWRPMYESSEEYSLERIFKKQASKLYKSKNKRMLNIQISSAVIFYISHLLLLILAPHAWPIVVGSYLLRLLVQYLIYIPIAKKLRITRMLWFFPILDVSHTFYLGIHLGSKKI